MQEAIVWRQLNHPNLLPFMGVYYLDNNLDSLCLVSPWMEQGNLLQFMKNSPELVEPDKLAYDVACGLTHLHDMKVVHGDLKGVNILITPDLRASIGDFGLTRISDTQRLLSSRTNHSLGTTRWLSPELQQPGPDCVRSKASDVYAYGCVCYEIYTGKIPFHELPDAAVVIAIVMHKLQPTRPGNTLVLADAVWDTYSRPTMVNVLARVREFFPGVSSEPATCWGDRDLTQIWDDVECSAPIVSSGRTIESRRTSGGRVNPQEQESAAGRRLTNDIPQLPLISLRHNFGRPPFPPLHTPMVDTGADTRSNAPYFTLNRPGISTSISTTAQSKSKVWIQGAEEEGEYEQYFEVYHSDIKAYRYICSHTSRGTVFREQRYVEVECDRKVFVGNIARLAGSVQVTIVCYEGQGAREAWMEDFKRCTGFLSADRAPLLAISRSKIPLLVFTNDLVPAAHFLANVGPLARVYFRALIHRLSCWDDKVWMDPQRGVFCKGPEGPPPKVFLYPARFEIKDVPSSVELLQEDVAARFLAGCKSEAVDVRVVDELCSAGQSNDTDLEFSHPTIISTSTNTPIAIGGADWATSNSDQRLIDRVLLGNGLIRFTLDASKNVGLEDGYDGVFDLSTGCAEMTWLSQASNIFHAYGISLEDNLSAEYKLVVPHLRLRGHLSASRSKPQRLPEQPIYLFVQPLPVILPARRPTTTSSFHYWSFEEDGQSSLSTDMCHHLSLSNALELTVEHYSICSWPNEIYQTMHRYQVAHGFDPTTADFARFLGYGVYQVRHDSGRFEEVDDAMEVD